MTPSQQIRADPPSGVTTPAGGALELVGTQSGVIHDQFGTLAWRNTDYVWHLPQWPFRRYKPKRFVWPENQR